MSKCGYKSNSLNASKPIILCHVILSFSASFNTVSINSKQQFNLTINKTVRRVSLTPVRYSFVIGNIFNTSANASFSMNVNISLFLLFDLKLVIN